MNIESLLLSIVIGLLIGALVVLVTSMIDLSKHKWEKSMKLNPTLPYLLIGRKVNNIVEMTDTESFMLWKEYQDDNIYKTENSRSGLHVGFINGDENMPIWISLQFGKYKGVEFLKWEATSRFVDYNVITAWFKEHFPEAIHTNAMNIHNVKWGELKWKQKKLKSYQRKLTNLEKL